MPHAPELRLAGGRLRLRFEDAEGVPVEAFWTTPAGGAGGASKAWTHADRGYRAQAGPLQITVEAVRQAAGVLVFRLTGGGPGLQVREFGLRLPIEMGGTAPAWLAYSGYQSWDPAGLSLLAREGSVHESWWTAGLASAGGEGLAWSARTAGRLGTLFSIRDGQLEIRLRNPPGILAAPSVELAAGARPVGETVAVTAGPDLQPAMRRAAGGRPRGRPPRGWLSWYHFGPWITADEIRENSARVLEPDLAPLGAQVIQIDDGWQEAYGDWRPNTKFQDLRRLNAELTERGQVPGVWTAPFLVSAASDLGRHGPESWFVRDPAGGGRAIDHRHTIFGPMYVLDARRAAVKAHLEEVFRGLRELGFRYFKIDFLYAGAYAGVAAFRAGLRAIRRGAGPDSYLLACGAPLLPVKGLAEGCRIGADTCTPLFDFERGEPAPTYFGDEVAVVARNVAARSHLSGWFQPDPDVALAGGNLDLERSRQLVTAVALSGGPYFLGDHLSALSPERFALAANLEVAALADGTPPATDWNPDPADRPPRTWRRPQGVVALFNWTDQPEVVELPARGPARDLWSGAELTPAGGALRVEIPASGVRLLRLAGGRL